MKMWLLAVNHKLVAAEEGGGSVVNARTDPDHPGPWEEFDEIPLGGPLVAIQTTGGFYFSAQPGGTLDADRLSVGPWEQFQKFSTPSGVGYRSLAFERWISADLGIPVSTSDWSGHRLVCNRLRMGPYETFEQIHVSPNRRVRDPLPPFDPADVDPETGAPLPVSTTLPPIPSGPELSFWRANFSGIRVTGLPPVPGGSVDSSLVFTPFLDRYSEGDQEKILDETLQRGYTHFTLSWPDSRAFGESLARYVETARRVKQAGLWVDHHFFSKDFDWRNPDPDSSYPVIGALLAHGAIDLATVGWELNAFVDPEHLQSLIDGVTSHLVPYGIPVYLHFLPHYASWQADAERPHDFWMRQVGKIRGLKYQCDPSWSAGMMQARLNDVLARLAPGGLWGTPGFDVVAWEVTALSQFLGRLDETRGDLRGYELMCTPGPMPPSGYGNGARRIDGSAL